METVTQTDESAAGSACGRGRVRTRRSAPVRRRRDGGRRAERRLARHPEGAAHGGHGTVGLRQVDAHAHPRRSRPADLRQRVDRRHRHHRDGRPAAHAPAPQPHRLHLPVLQPLADADRRGERDASARPRRREDRQGVDRRGRRQGRPGRPPPSPALGAVGRAAAARRHRAGARQPADGAVRRRADGQPGLEHGRGDPRTCCATRSTPTARRP